MPKSKPYENIAITADLSAHQRTSADRFGSTWSRSGTGHMSSRTLNDEKSKLLFEQAEHEGWRVNLEHACVKHACVAFSEYCEAFEDSLSL